MTPAEWLSDIGSACEELGYGIRRIEPGRVDVIALDKAGTLIRLESVLMSASLLRAILRPIEREQAIRAGAKP